jgi:hypothetical protein
MAHAGGAFKTNSANRGSAVKESNQPEGAGCPSENRKIKIRARNLAKSRLLHKK